MVRFKETDGITHDRLISLGFTLRMNIYNKGKFSVSFYKHLWKACCGMSGEFDVKSMPDLFSAYRKLTGEELATEVLK